MIIAMWMLLQVGNPNRGADALALKPTLSRMPAMMILVALYILSAPPISSVTTYAAVLLTDRSPLLPHGIDAINALVELQGINLLELPIGGMAIFFAMDIPVSTAMGSVRRACVEKQHQPAAVIRATIPIAAALTTGAAFLHLSILVSALWPTPQHSPVLAQNIAFGYVNVRTATWAAEQWLDWEGPGGGRGIITNARSWLQSVRAKLQTPRKQTAPNTA